MDLCELFTHIMLGSRTTFAVSFIGTDPYQTKMEHCKGIKAMQEQAERVHISWDVFSTSCHLSGTHGNCDKN